MDLYVFETWTYHRVLKISWNERMHNEEVLRRINEVAIKHKNSVMYLCDIKNCTKYKLLQLINECKMELIIRCDAVTEHCFTLWNVTSRSNRHIELYNSFVEIFGICA